MSITMGTFREPSSKKLLDWVDKRTTAIWKNLFTNHLWQRLVKNTLATTICLILAITPAVHRSFGPAAYLAPIVTVFGHPGRRFGQLVEALVLIVCGGVVGTAWSTLGIYLSSLVFTYNESAAYTIKGVFLAVVLLVHGLLRSHTPRLFGFVVLLVLVSVVTLTGISKEVAPGIVTGLLYPILTAVGVLLVVNTLVFPEFSSSFLGITTIETLGETVGALRDAGRYFVTLTNDMDISEGTPMDGQNIQPLKLSTTAAEKPERPNLSKSGKSINQRMLGMLKGGKEKQKEKKDHQTGRKPIKLKDLTVKKAKLRGKLASCKAAQQECNFELAWSVLPPRDLRAISDTSMKKLVANVISLIGACESRYALLGDIKEPTEDEEDVEQILDKSAGNEDASSPPSRKPEKQESGDSHWFRKGENKSRKDKVQSRSSSKTRLAKERENLELVKPKKEIEFGDTELLKYLVGHVSRSLSDLQENIDRSVDVVTSCLAYCYDVKRLPSGALAPKGIRLEEIDIRVDVLTDSLEVFDKDSAAALEGAASFHNGLDGPQVDVMPRMETFLISSFLLNLRQAALHTLEMLKHSRLIVEKRQERHGRRRVYTPIINWKKWLVSGGEEDMLAMPSRANKKARTGGGADNAADEDDSSGNAALLDRRDTEMGPERNSPATPSKTEKVALKKPKPGHSQNKSVARRVRNGLADSLEYLTESEDVSYAIKITVATFIVSFPAFVAKWNNWYHLNRAMWAAVQLVLVMEVAIGTSIWTFMVRAVGTTLGCLWGFLAYEAGNGNRVVCVVMLVIGVIPSAYVQLGSKYVKSGMVSIISMCIVALGTVDPSIPGTAAENFSRRLIAFLIGGLVALSVEVLLFPVRARDRLVESLAGSIKEIGEMQACLAYGIESEANLSDIKPAEVMKRFEAARAKAQGALAAAETFLPFCDQEPRLKGSFQGLALIYSEILYVLHAIVDRMDNMLHLRNAYGSGVLEEFNAQIFPYRRNVAGSITLVLFAVHEGLTTKLPLPQYLPSARLAHLRLVNRVREVFLEAGHDGFESLEERKHSITGHLELAIVKRIFRKKFLAWNAVSAGLTEVIEYLEELIDLVKLLVGASEFRSGLLTRPTYREYVGRTDRNAQMDGEGLDKKGGKGKGAAFEDERNEEDDTMPEPREVPAVKSRRATMSRRAESTDRRNDDFMDDGAAGISPMEEDGLPRSLQRVRSRRLEETRLQRTRSGDANRMRQQHEQADEIVNSHAGNDEPVGK